MDELLQLLGQALPDTATIFRLKVVFGTSSRIALVSRPT